MSGLEVAGLMLGSLSLVISAVEHYTTLVQTMNRAIKYKIELKSLKHELDAESIIFLDSLERVLDGLIPAKQLEELLSNPKTPLWQDNNLNEKLKDRLGRSYSVFTDTVNEMHITIDQFNKRLDVDDQGKVRWTENTGLKLALKRAGFSLRKHNFDDLIRQLQKHNRHLEKFTNRSLEFEPSRQKRRVERSFERLGDYARSIFHALEASFKCDCHHSSEHTALFGLTPPSALALPQPTEPQHKMDFHVVITALFPEQGQARDGKAIWQEVYMEPDEQNEIQHGTAPTFFTPQSNTSTNIQVSALSDRSASSSRFGAQKYPSRPKKQVGFAPSPATVNHHTTSTAFTAQSKDRNIQISSMCQVFRCPPSCRYPISLGYILNGNSKFLVYPLDRSSNSSNKCWSTLSLGYILQNDGATTVPPLTLWGRLSLAAKLACAVLQLHASPWLQSNWDNKDILFLQRDDGRLYEQVFVGNKILKSGKKAIQPAHLSIFNETLVALAVVLVELSLGPIEKLQTSDDLQAGIYAPMVTLWRLANGNEIEGVFGPMYQSALKRCVELAKMSNILDDQIQQDFYHGVVSILEDQAMRRSDAI